MTVHLVNPSDLSFGMSVITPRWLYVLAAATPRQYGDPRIVDETLDHFDPATVQPGDVVGIGIHTLNALRGYAVGKMAREAGARVIFGGVHASLYPEESIELGGAHAVVKGDGDLAWGEALADCANGGPREIYEGWAPRAGTLQARSLGSHAHRQVHVGFGANGARVPEALFFLLGFGEPTGSVRASARRTP